MNEKPYIIHTSRNYTVSLPDVDKEVEVETSNYKEDVRMYFTKEDVLKLLERFD